LKILWVSSPFIGLASRKATQHWHQRTGLRPEGTGQVCWRSLWFAVGAYHHALPLMPTVARLSPFLLNERRL